MFKKFTLVASIIAIAFAFVFTLAPQHAFASGGSGGGGGGTKVDSIKVSKAEYALNNTLLVKAASSDTTATLSLYLPSGQDVGQVQNGGGSRYGGTVLLVSSDPGSVTIRSSSGGSVTVPTTPFQP